MTAPASAHILLTSPNTEKCHWTFGEPKGDCHFMQETLDIRHFDTAPNRGLNDAFEIASDAGTLLSSTVTSALPNLYENLSAAINGKAALLSTGQSALRTETIIEHIKLSANQDGERLDVKMDAK